MILVKVQLEPLSDNRVSKRMIGDQDGDALDSVINVDSIFPGLQNRISSSIGRYVQVSV